MQNDSSLHALRNESYIQEEVILNTVTFIYSRDLIHKKYDSCSQFHLKSMKDKTLNVYNLCGDLLYKKLSNFLCIHFLYFIYHAINNKGRLEAYGFENFFHIPKHCYLLYNCYLRPLRLSTLLDLSRYRRVENDSRAHFHRPPHRTSPHFENHSPSTCACGDFAKS